MNKRGFSLIEVVIAAGLMAVVALGIGSVVSYMSSMSSIFSIKEDYEDIFRAVQVLLLNENSCKTALNAAGAAPVFDPIGYTGNIDPVPAPTGPYRVAITSIVGTNGSAVVTSGAPLSATSRLNAGQIYLERDSAMPNGALANPDSHVNVGGISYNVWIANVYVPAALNPAKGPTPLGWPGINPRAVPITVVTNAANVMVNCYATTPLSSVCSALGATWNPANSQCGFPICNAADAGYDCAEDPQYSAGCKKSYMLAWVQSNGTMGNATKKCVCINTCNGGSYVVGPPGPPGIPAPAFAPNGTNGTPGNPGAPGIPNPALGGGGGPAPPVAPPLGRGSPPAPGPVYGY